MALMTFYNVQKQTVSSVRKLLERMASFLGLPFSLSQLSIDDQLDHVVINNSLPILGSIDQRAGTDFIDHLKAPKVFDFQIPNNKLYNMVYKNKD